MKVFISSVTAFLKEERNALPAFLKVADHEPLRFEDFTAQDRSSREACLAGVDAADVYLLLLGPKYGEPLPDSDRAPTAEEFTRARQRGIPILVFNKDVDEPDEPAQAEFKNEVGHYVSGRFWKSFTDPMSCNFAALQRCERSRPSRARSSGGHRPGRHRCRGWPPSKPPMRGATRSWATPASAVGAAVSYLVACTPRS
jgi:hypothetical protein